MIDAIVIGVTACSVLALLAWLVHGRIRAADDVAAAKVASGETRVELERARFELEVAEKALRAADARADALEEVIADDIARNPNADLDRADIRARVVRFSRRWAEADRERSLSPKPVAPVLDAGPAEASDDRTVPAEPGGVP